MTGMLADPALRPRVVAAGVLAGIALMLAAALLLVPVRARRAEAIRASDRAEPVALAVDSLLARYGVEKRNVTTWRVSTPDKGFSRIEQRVFVPPSFLSLQFNHDLGAVLAPLGARVIGTERAKEQIVTLHIVSENATVRSISLVTRAENGG